MTRDWMLSITAPPDYHRTSSLLTPPKSQLAIDPAQVHEWVCAHTPGNAEAVFIAGNGFRSIGAIQVLEEDLSRPVLTANQVAFWLALRFSGARIPIAGYGRILDRKSTRLNSSHLGI